MKNIHRYDIIKDLRHDVILGVDLIRDFGLALMVEEDTVYFPDGSCFKYSEVCETLVCENQDNENNEGYNE